MNWRCLIFGHVWRLRWYWAGYRLRSKAKSARCECLRCGKVLTDFSNPPWKPK